jgi:hypothetical protein
MKHLLRLALESIARWYGPEKIYKDGWMSRTLGEHSPAETTLSFGGTNHDGVDITRTSLAHLNSRHEGGETCILVLDVGPY